MWWVEVSGAGKHQKKVLGSLELEFQAVMWELGIELGSSGRAASSLNH